MKWYKATLLVMLATNVYSQNRKQLELFAAGGLQVNTFNSGFNTNVNSSINSFALGAGVILYGNFFLEQHFNFSMVHNKIRITNYPFQG